MRTAFVVAATTAWVFSVTPVFAADAASGEAADRTAQPCVLIQYNDLPSSELLAHALTRLRAELRAAGFTFTLCAEPSALEGSGAGAPYALIVLTVEEGQVRLDITSRSVGTSSHVILVGTRREVEALMLQATEFLRAGIVPRLGGAPRTPAPPSRAVTHALQPPQRQSHWVVDLGPSVLANWGAHDVLPLASFGIGFNPSPSTSVRVAFDVPVGKARYETQQGAVDYRIWLGTLTAEYAPLRGTYWGLSLGLEAGGARVLSSGKPVAPLEPRDAALWTLAMGARATSVLRVSRRFALITQLRVLSLSPNPVVAILDNERRLGSPCILLGFGARLVDE